MPPGVNNLLLPMLVGILAGQVGSSHLPLPGDPRIPPDANREPLVLARCLAALRESVAVRTVSKWCS